MYLEKAINYRLIKYHVFSRKHTVVLAIQSFLFTNVNFVEHVPEVSSFITTTKIAIYHKYLTLGLQPSLRHYQHPKNSFMHYMYVKHI